jgi:hypothetical protein
MNVPLPPCVERARARRPDMTGNDIMWAIWRHAVNEEQPGGCWGCYDAGAVGPPVAPFEDVDVGEYADLAGRALVAAGTWSPDMLLTNRQHAEALEQAFRLRKGRAT